MHQGNVPRPRLEAISTGLLQTGPNGRSPPKRPLVHAAERRQGTFNIRVRHPTSFVPK